MIAKILAILVLLFMTAPVAQAQQRGRGAQRAPAQRGSQRAPAPYYGGGVYGPGRRSGYQDQRWRGVPGGRFWRGQYYAPGVGPCWALLPVVGWTWTCGP